MTTETLLRQEGLVTSLSWIPTEAIEGAQRLAFDSGITHYDVPPPTDDMNVEALRDEDRFRFANELRAFISVDGEGRILDCGYLGRGLMGSTLVNLGAVKHRFQAVQLPDLQREPERGDGWVRFVQTCGGRTGVPAPRRVRRKPFIQWQAPLVWTTLSLTLHADGRAEHALIGASRFPRHWVYGPDNRLSHKSGLTDFKDWYRKSFGKHSPWGDEDSEALVSAVESALETSLSAQLMQGKGERRIERFPAGTVLFKEGDPGTDVLLILDGIVRIECGGERLAEYGPGALLGERAHLEGGIRTSSNIAVTPCRVALFDANLIERSHLEELSAGHRREQRHRETDQVRVSFCGTRGSTPAPGPDFVRFGGHTSCVALSHDGPADGPVLLLDAGTGLRRVPSLLGAAPFQGTMLLSHLHWDHVQGLPFFGSGDRDDARVTMLIPMEHGSADASALLGRMMSPPFFPIAPTELRGHWTFGPLPEGSFEAEGFTVTAHAVPHKGGRTLGLRIADGRTSVAYIPDHQPTALGPGPDGVGEYHDAVLELSDGVDLLVHDSHLRQEELEAQASFGHAAAEYAVRLGRKAGAAQVALFHHRPDRSDREVERTVARFADEPVLVFGAAEGLTVVL